MVYANMKVMMALMLQVYLFFVAILSKAHPTASLTRQTPHWSIDCEMKFNFIPFW